MLPLATSTVIAFLQNTVTNAVLGYLDLLQELIGYIFLMALITWIVAKLLRLTRLGSKL